MNSDFAGNLALKINSFVGLGHLCTILFCALASWVFYLVALSSLSNDRHSILFRQFKGLVTLTVFLVLAYGLHSVLSSYRLLIDAIGTTLLYTGVLTIILGAGTLVKILKIAAIEYFFFMNMEVGIPLLLIHVSSLVLSLLVAGWMLSVIFQVELASLLATSAVLSIVLGLALQDTLGNLFAGISLQIDKPFELEDWIELKNGGEKILGQVKELSWRATLLLSVTDELITIPNRMLAQWQIVNYSGRVRPFYRGYYFRLPFDVDLDLAKACFVNAAHEIPEILSHPPTLAIVIETTESWITVKVVYPLKDFGRQFIVGDKYHVAALSLLQKHGIALASNRLQLSENGKPG